MIRAVSTGVLACLALSLVGCNPGNLPGSGGPFSSDIYAATAGGVSVSLTGGTSWSTIGSLPNVNTIVAVPSSAYVSLYAGTNVGLYLSTDGATWPTVLLSGAGQVNDVFVSGTNIYAATSTGAWVYNGSWTNNNSALLGTTSSVVQGIYFDGTNIYAATTGGLSISANGGTSWTGYTSGLPSNNIYSVFSDGTNVYVGTDTGIAETPIASLPVWTTPYTISNGLASNTVYGIFVYSGIIYAATSAGPSVLNSSIWTTYLSGTSVYSVSVSGTDIYAATATGVWISLNSGVSWSNYTTSQGLASNSVKSLSVQ